MKCYGKTFRYLERARQLSVDESDKYMMCKSCKKMRPARDFKGEFRDYKSCKKCRDKARAYLERKDGR